MTVHAESDAVLQIDEARYRLATAVAPLGAWSWDLVRDVVNFDAPGAELFGLDHDAPYRWTKIVTTRVHVDDVAQVNQAVAGASKSAGNDAFLAEFRVVRPDGNERWLRVAGQAIPVDNTERKRDGGAERTPVLIVGIALDVTLEHGRSTALREAVEAERAARIAVDAERARLDRIITQLPAPVAVYEGRELRFRALSAAYQRIIGGREVVGQPIRDALPELSGGADGTDFFALLQHVFESGETVTGTNDISRWDDNGDGIPEEHIIDFVYAPLRAADGAEVDGVIALVLDMTSRARAEAALRESETRFRTTADAAPVLIWTAGRDGGREWHNRPWLTFTGTTLTAASEFGWMAHVHPEDLQRCLDTQQRAFAERQPYTLEYRLRRYDGVYRYFLVNAVPRFAEGGTDDSKFLGYIGTCADVTEMREARIDAEVARSVARGLVESLGDAFVAYDADFRFTYVNDAAAARFANTSSTTAPVGQVLWDAYPQLIGTPVETAMRQAMTERTTVQFEAHDASLRQWFAVRVYPVATGGVTAVWTDVTPERRAREATSFLADASRALAASLDYATTLRVVAAAAVPRLGDWCAIDMVTDPVSREWPPTVERLVVVHRDPDMLALAAELAARYPTDWSEPGGMAGVLRDGVPFFLPEITDEIVVAGARDAEHLSMLRAIRFSSILVVPLVARGLTLGALTLCMTESDRRYDEADRDLALDVAHRAALAVDNARLFRDAEQARLDAEIARRDAERQRAEAEAANAAKAQFLSTMSHELRTPLNAIGGYAELLALGLRGPITDAQRKDLGRVQSANQHLLALVNDLLNFARVDAGQLEYRLADVDLSELVAELEPLILPQFLSKNIAFEVDGFLPCASDEKPFRLRADQEKLRQILLNLLSNAVKFTPTGGRVKLLCEADRAAARVLIRVTDTGRGIDPDQHERIFEPFVQVDRHRTPDRQQGVGLGLSISRELARRMGGDLTIESTRGPGTTFTLAMPMGSLD